MGKDKRQKLWYTAKQLETTNLKKTGAEEMTAEKLFEHQGAILLAQSDGCAVWQFRNETGDGTMTTYEIFSGVMLAFNDFHMERYECDFVADRRMLAIDQCREGRMDYAASDNLVAYTAAGDIILDEATASIDPENEHPIQQAISELTRGKTIITIAHRLATIRSADRILVVEDGRIAESGTHDELVKQNDVYCRFIAIREQAELWRIAAE